VEVSGNEAPFNLMVEYAGIFLFENVLSDPDVITRIA
jgi:hypothetical protein